MSLRTLLMSHPKLAKAFMSSRPEAFHMKGGERLIAKTLRNAVERTTAYPAFLREHGIEPRDALDPTRFHELPLTSKRDYVARYTLGELCLDGKPSCAYTIERSSGHSGTPHYWLRTPEEDALMPTYMEFALRQFAMIDRAPTLVIVGMALGTWAAGEKIAQAARTVAASGKYELSVISPGINTEEILDAVQDLSPYFAQTLIFGYPPFMKVVIEEGIRRGIDWKACNVRMLLAGEGFSEAWRRHVGEKLGIDTTTDLMGIGSGYGTADAGGSIGREYPVTVAIRQLADADESLARDLFGGTEVPNLFQWSPGGCWVEAVEGKLVFTASSGIPLVRYAIGDNGGVLGFDHVMGVLKDHGYDVIDRLVSLGYDRQDVWRMPFFHCLGRADGAVLVGGLNIYPDNINAALAAVETPDITGFKIGTTPSEDDEYTKRLLILLEHREAELSESDALAIAEAMTTALSDGLALVNREYRRLREADASLARPVVRVYPAGHGPFAADAGKIKRRYVA